MKWMLFIVLCIGVGALWSQDTLFVDLDNPPLKSKIKLKEGKTEFIHFNKRDDYHVPLYSKRDLSIYPEDEQPISKYDRTYYFTSNEENDCVLEYSNLKPGKYKVKIGPGGFNTYSRPGKIYHFVLVVK